jgi:predicted Na+-dependent transporter
MSVKTIIAAIARLLLKRNSILVLGVVLGFVLWPLAQYTRWLIIPALAVAMMLAVSRNNLKEIFSLRAIGRPLLGVLLLNFVILGGLNVLAGELFTREQMLRAGFLILAASPPAIAITPFSYELSADVRFSAAAAITGYLASLAIMTLMVNVFLGGQYQPLSLFLTLVELIILPLIASQVMRLSGVTRHTEKYHGTVINWCFFLVVFSVVGLNRNLIVGSPRYLLAPAAAAFISIFVLGQVIRAVSKKLKIARDRSLSYMLLGTMKNWAGAGAIAIAVFGPQASIPSAVGLVFGILYYVWLVFRYGGGRE